MMTGFHFESERGGENETVIMREREREMKKK